MLKSSLFFLLFHLSTAKWQPNAPGRQSGLVNHLTSHSLTQCSSHSAPTISLKMLTLKSPATSLLLNPVNSLHSHNLCFSSVQYLTILTISVPLNFSSLISATSQIFCISPTYQTGLFSFSFASFCVSAPLNTDVPKSSVFSLLLTLAPLWVISTPWVEISPKSWWLSSLYLA